MHQVWLFVSWRVHGQVSRQHFDRGLGTSLFLCVVFLIILWQGSCEMDRPLFTQPSKSKPAASQWNICHLVNIFRFSDIKLKKTRKFRSLPSATIVILPTIQSKTFWLGWERLLDRIGIFLRCKHLFYEDNPHPSIKIDTNLVVISH